MGIATYGYHPATGRATTTTAAGSDGVTRTITRSYDTLGRPTGYTDADGNTATISYDLRGRVVSTTNAKGSQTRSYDTTTGDLTGLQDSALGAIVGTYDADGQLTRQTLPNGASVETTYDETGAAVRRKYATSSSTLYDDTVTETVHGQWLTQVSTGSSQTYAYDAAGRITRVSDTRSGQCTVRDYTYDRDSNRSTRIVHPPVFLFGTCDPGSAGTKTAYSYDTADRVIDGETYDSFGRTIGVPAAEAGGTVLTSTYYADDTVRGLTQGSSSHLYGLDPLTRVRSDDATIPGFLGLATSTTATSHYDDDSDNPAWISEAVGGMSWTRNIPGIDGDLLAIQDETNKRLQITNLHGDVVATGDAISTPNPSAISEADEFGNPTTASTTRYQWLGAKQRSTVLPTGITLMGERLYNPALGRFLQVDPVEGGSANDYDYTNQDPVNQLDLDGRCAFDMDLGPGVVDTGKYTYWERCKNGRRTGYDVFKNCKLHYRGVFKRPMGCSSRKTHGKGALKFLKRIASTAVGCYYGAKLVKENFPIAGSPGAVAGCAGGAVLTEHGFEGPMDGNGG
jgi:RHS repeat-associated protein